MPEASDDLAGLRPTADTAAAFEASLAAIDVADQANRRAQSALASWRRDVMRTGTAPDIQKVDAEAGELRAVSARLASLRDELLPGLAEARRRELRAQLRADAEAAAALVVELEQFALEDYPALVARIIQGLALDERTHLAITRYRQGLEAAGLDAAELATFPAIATPYDTADRRTRLYQTVSLPAALPPDPSDETPIPFYLPAIRGPHLVGTISAAHIARGRPVAR